MFCVILSIKTYREAPVYPQVDGYKKNIFRKYIHLFGPSSDSRVTTASQFGKEKCIECVDGGQIGVFAAFNQKVHVKVDNLEESG